MSSSHVYALLWPMQQNTSIPLVQQHITVLSYLLLTFKLFFFTSHIMTQQQERKIPSQNKEVAPLCLESVMHLTKSCSPCLDVSADTFSYV